MKQYVGLDVSQKRLQFALSMNKGADVRGKGEIHAGRADGLEFTDARLKPSASALKLARWPVGFGMNSVASDYR